MPLGVVKRPQNVIVDRRLPSERCAASESSSTMLALAMPQACGDAPLPDSGWVPVHGEPGFGNCWLSHQEYGPLCPAATMNW